MVGVMVVVFRLRRCLADRAKGRAVAVAEPKITRPGVLQNIPDLVLRVALGFELGVVGSECPDVRVTGGADMGKLGDRRFEDPDDVGRDVRGDETESVLRATGYAEHLARFEEPVDLGFASLQGSLGGSRVGVAGAGAGGPGGFGVGGGAGHEEAIPQLVTRATGSGPALQSDIRATVNSARVAPAQRSGRVVRALLAVLG
jgi:hypothetical protein